MSPVIITVPIPMEPSDATACADSGRTGSATARTPTALPPYYTNMQVLDSFARAS